MWKPRNRDFNYLNDGQTEVNIGDFWFQYYDPYLFCTFSHIKA